MPDGRATSLQPGSAYGGGGLSRPARPEPQQLGDILERVLDKGIVIVGDIQVRLLDIELLTIKLRLVVASLERAKEMGIDWWEGDPFLSSRAQQRELPRGAKRTHQDRATALERRPASKTRRATPARKHRTKH
jgi:Gas vesicle protein